MGIVIWNVDTQHDFMDVDGKLAVPDAQKIVGNLTAIIGAAERAGIRILGSADDHNMASAEFKQNGGPFDPHCIRGTKGQENIPGTILEEGKVGIVRWDEKYSLAVLQKLFSMPQVILTKDDNDVFTNPFINELLGTIPKGSVIAVIGVATEYCDSCALLGLVKYNNKHQMGWQIEVVTDAIKEITEEGGRAAMEEFRRLGIKEVTTLNSTWSLSLVERINDLGRAQALFRDAAREREAKRMKLK